MWVTKLLIFQVKKRIFYPKTTKFCPKLAFLVNLGQCPVGGSVGGCGARAVSRKTPIYFIILVSKRHTSYLQHALYHAWMLKEDY